MSYRGGSSQDRLSAKTKAIAYQTQPIGSPVLPDEIDDVSVRQPRADDRKLERWLENPEEG